MEWTEGLKRAISYMEDHLLEDIGAGEVADEIHISPFYLQKGFRIMTGYSIGEYIRCRRLYLAALDMLMGEQKVIDLAYKYGYDTPESFTRAFTRFHGASPASLKGDAGKIRTFLPLKVTVSVKGGNAMDHVVERMDRFWVIGYEREVDFEDAYQKIPAFWNEFAASYAQGKNSREAREVIEACMVGQFGICMTDTGASRFHYVIAGKYEGGPVPEGMRAIEIPAMEWAKFRCVGPLPGALQAMNARIFQEWLPGNTAYEMAAGIDIEWYSQGDMGAADYLSEIWVPVVRKENV